MALRTVTRRFGISAPRVAVYTQLPWYWQLAVMITIVAIVSGLAWATFLLGKSFAFRPFDPNAGTRETVEQTLARVQRENESLRASLAALEQRQKIDSAAQAHVNEQLKALTEQNARIKEELAFFQAIGGNGAGVSIQRFTVSADASPGDYRFRLLAVQSSQRAEHFRGRVELIVSIADKGTERRIVFPQSSDKAQPFVLGFKFFQRMEGAFKLPPEVKLVRVEARVFPAGADTPLATQLAALN